jgi:nitrous oxide reductase accessory protein NosL
MKKRNLIIAILLVLSLSFVLLGCPPDGDPDPDPEPDPWELTDAAKTTLKGIGINNLPTPGAGTFIDCKTNTETAGTKKVILGWTGCSDKFTEYKAKFSSNLASVSIARTIPSTVANNKDIPFSDENKYYGIVYQATGNGSDIGLTASTGDIIVYIEYYGE